MQHCIGCGCMRTMICSWISMGKNAGFGNSGILKLGKSTLSSRAELICERSETGQRSRGTCFLPDARNPVEGEEHQVSQRAIGLAWPIQWLGRDDRIRGDGTV